MSVCSSSLEPFDSTGSHNSSRRANCFASKAQQNRNVFRPRLSAFFQFKLYQRLKPGLGPLGMLTGAPLLHPCLFPKHNGLQTSLDIFQPCWLALQLHNILNPSVLNNGMVFLVQRVLMEA